MTATAGTNNPSRSLREGAGKRYTHVPTWLKRLSCTNSCGNGFCKIAETLNISSRKIHASHVPQQRAGQAHGTGHIGKAGKDGHYNAEW